MHLTNYAINKLSKEYWVDWADCPTHKRSLQDIWRNLYANFEASWVDSLLQSIDGIIIKTIISALSKLKWCYSRFVREEVSDSICFEVLGFEILVDKQLKPWLIEVNHAPSFATETQFDLDLK